VHPCVGRRSELEGKLFVLARERRDLDGLRVAGACSPYQADHNASAGIAGKMDAAHVGLAFTQAQLGLLNAARLRALELDARAVLAHKWPHSVHLDVPAGPTGLNGSPIKRRKGEFDGGGAASVTGLANFLSVSISAHTCVVAGSMYPPKISGLIGSPLLDASMETLRLPDGSAKAVILCCNRAAPATEAAMNSRRFIVISYLLTLNWICTFAQRSI
jgi:hypothetical protein